MFQSSLLVGLFGHLASAPLAYWLVWLSSLGLSIALVVLLRTRWGQSRPLHKCAVLSLLVHLLLAWVAMTVRIVAGGGDGGDGLGPSIRVRVVEDPNDGPVVAEVSADRPPEAAPPLLEPPAEEVAPPVDDVQAKVSEPVDEPAAVEPVTAETKPVPVEIEVSTKKEAEKVAEASAEAAPKPTPTASAEKPPEAQSNSVPSVNAAKQPTSVTSPTTADQPPAVAAQPAAPPTANTPYSLRDAPGRLGLVEQQGGSGQTEAAVDAALNWLTEVQSRDGRWDGDEFGAGQEQAVLGHNRGGAGRNADTGISALALLTFLGAGHSHQHGAYQDVVHRGLDFLLRSQGADGNLFGDATLYAQMYCHSMATFALAEAQAMTRDRRLEPAVTKAVQFSLAAQNTTTGGWRYRPGDSGDTSQLGWQIMALASAERAGVSVPPDTWFRIERFLRSVARGNYGGLASYRPDSPASTSMTAEALYCRLLLAEARGNRVDDSVAQEATTQLLGALPDAQHSNLYYWYYATLALHHRHQNDDAAAAAWKEWNDAMTVALVSTQVADGPNAGSWNTNTLWGGYGGRVYTTAMAAMCLEVYYRYAPPPRGDRWTATRPDAHPSR
jgi:outer membrane biosynthesis protein TonB